MFKINKQNNHQLFKKLIKGPLVKTISYKNNNLKRNQRNKI